MICEVVLWKWCRSFQWDMLAGDLAGVWSLHSTRGGPIHRHHCVQVESKELKGTFHHINKGLFNFMGQSLALILNKGLWDHCQCSHSRSWLWKKLCQWEGGWTIDVALSLGSFLSSECWLTWNWSVGWVQWSVVWLAMGLRLTFPCWVNTSHGTKLGSCSFISYSQWRCASNSVIVSEELIVAPNCEIPF